MPIITWYAVIGALGADAAEVLSALRVTALQVYWVPFLSPDTSTLVAVVVHERPLGADVIRWLKSVYTA